MHSIQRFMLIFFCVLCVSSEARAQQRGWGIEAGGSYTTWPSSILENVVDEQYANTVSLDGHTFTGRLCRFKDNGAPSYSVGYVQNRVSLNATDREDNATLDGYGILRGVIITKYFNFVERSGGSFGLLLGGGIAQGSFGAVETFTPPDQPSYVDTEEWKNKPFPLLEFGVHGDVRMGRRFSVFFVGGLQHIALGFGGGVRFRFR